MCFSPESGSPGCAAAPSGDGSCAAHACWRIVWCAQTPKRWGPFPSTPRLVLILLRVMPPRSTWTGRQLSRRGGPLCASAGPSARSCWLLGSAVRGGVHLTRLFLGNVTSASGPQMASGVSLGSFGSRPDGTQQRSYSVSSADQWSEATVIANSAISSGKRGCGPTDPRPPQGPRPEARGWTRRPQALRAPLCVQHRGAACPLCASRLSAVQHGVLRGLCRPSQLTCSSLVLGGVAVHPHLTDWKSEAADRIRG